MEDLFHRRVREDRKNGFYIHRQSIHHGVDVLAGQLHQAEFFFIDVKAVGFRVYGEIFVFCQLGGQFLEFFLGVDEGITHVKYNNI